MALAGSGEGDDGEQGRALGHVCANGDAPSAYITDAEQNNFRNAARKSVFGV